MIIPLFIIVISSMVQSIVVLRPSFRWKYTLPVHKIHGCRKQKPKLGAISLIKFQSGCEISDTKSIVAKEALYNFSRVVKIFKSTDTRCHITVNGDHIVDTYKYNPYHSVQSTMCQSEQLDSSNCINS